MARVAEKSSVSPKDMTLDEYKAYFDEKMNSLYTHLSQRGMNWTIDITESAYKRMQSDPEYEKKILDAEKNVYMTNKQLAELAPWSEKLHSIKNRM